jgi:hypothetical protein
VGPPCGAVHPLDLLVIVVAVVIGVGVVVVVDIGVIVIVTTMGCGSGGGDFCRDPGGRGLLRDRCVGGGGDRRQNQRRRDVGVSVVVCTWSVVYLKQTIYLRVEAEGRQIQGQSIAGRCTMYMV